MQGLRLSWSSFRSRGVEWLTDVDGWRYRFERWPLNLFPDRADCVYAFANRDREVLLIGSAGDLRERVFGHERLRDALNGGASEVWAHTPGGEDPFPLGQVEARLIAALRPPLNRSRRRAAPRKSLMRAARA